MAPSAEDAAPVASPAADRQRELPSGEASPPAASPEAGLPLEQPGGEELASVGNALPAWRQQQVLQEAEDALLGEKKSWKWSEVPK